MGDVAGPRGGEADSGRANPEVGWLMVTTGIQNLPEPLARAEAAYRDPAAQLAPVSRDRLARRVEHFASSVQFVLDEPDATRRLHDLTKDLRTVPRLSALLPQVLRGAMALVGGDFGNMQILDPATGSLRLVTQAGFGREFCEYFAVVDDGHSACGQAARQCAQTVIADVRTDPGFAPHREIAAAAGFRGVQSTPLVDYAGHLVGMVSTHFQRLHRPSDRDLRIMELYADFAGEAVTRHLAGPPVRIPPIRWAGRWSRPCSIPHASGKPTCRSRSSCGLWAG